ncbi:MAG: acyl-CoA dehydrogenase [Acidimicrobiales bacterium]|nr:acyl-CoA dehydrogenase [Acidimicrobiales bacterium]
MVTAAMTMMKHETRTTRMTTPTPSATTIGISDEHRALSETVRRWVASRVDQRATKAMLDAECEELPEFWSDLVAQRWLGLHVPEVHGGEGFGFAELAVVVEELGRACTPGPFLPTAMVAGVLALAGTSVLRAEFLPRLANGECLAALCTGRQCERVLDAEAIGRGGDSSHGGSGAHDRLRLSGRAGPVLGVAVADVVLAPAVDHQRGHRWWAVLERSQPGVRIHVEPSTDQTRRVGWLEVDAAEVALTRCLRDADEVIAAVVTTLASAEAVGGSSWCVETAASYACERVQFGRPIGQFQAVKHRCADMLLRTELARAAAWDAARALDALADRLNSERADAGEGVSTGAGRLALPATAFGSLGVATADDASTGALVLPEVVLAASVAGAIAPDAFFTTAKDCIQVLGGIGYTWEHDAHLYLKRALAMRQLLGGPHEARATAARLVLGGTRRHLRVDLPAEAEDRRAEVRAFIDELRTHPKSEWNRLLAESGYLVPHWPSPWGRNAGPVEQLVIDEELAAARIRRPHLQVGAWVLPTIIAHGTRAQQERWIPPTLRGEITWCQLFSEPGAGSDLASLTTRAVRDEPQGGWRITGQKVWTTLAHVANWGLLLARTDPTAPKHDGITAFVVDMSWPGIEVRPLRELTGAELFNEVFFDDVFVPDECVVGELNRGWEAARTTLANERVSMGSGSSFGPGAEAVFRLVTERGRQTDPVVLDEVGALVAEGQAVAAMGLRMTARALAGAAPGAESSVRKLLATEYEQRVQEVGLSLLGADAACNMNEAAVWIAGFLGNRALSIAGGTSDVQRNIIAERLLGLPKDPET